MPRIVKIEPANNGRNKWIATFDTGKTTKFGSFGQNDYTLTGNKEARERYRARHKKDLDTGDPTRAGYLSMFVLWNLPTISASVKDFNKRFG
jgi:hypothetical protein